MIDLSDISKKQPTTKTDRWKMILIISGVIHISLLIGCPNFVVPPRLSQQIFKIAMADVIWLLPFVWSVFLLFSYRTLEERVIGYISLVVSLFWLAVATILTLELAKSLDPFH